MLLKCSAIKGKHQIQDRWENFIYKVVEHSYDGIPAFNVLPRDGDGKTKIVHCNLLLPIGETLETKRQTTPQLEVRKLGICINGNCRQVSLCELRDSKSNNDSNAIKNDEVALDPCTNSAGITVHTNNSSTSYVGQVLFTRVKSLASRLQY